MESEEVRQEPLTLHTVQLDQIILESCSVKNNYLNFNQADVSGMLTVEPRKLESFSEISGPDSFIFHLTVELVVKTKRRILLKVQLTLAGIGHCLRDVEASVLEKFLSEAGIYLLWPYVRMCVGTFTQMTGTKPVPVPMFEIPKRFSETADKPIVTESLEDKDS